MQTYSKACAYWTNRNIEETLMNNLLTTLTLLAAADSLTPAERGRSTTLMNNSVEKGRCVLSRIMPALSFKAAVRNRRNSRPWC